MRTMMKLTDEELSLVLDQCTVHENLLQDYFKSVFHDFESYPRTKSLRKKTATFFESI